MKIRFVTVAVASAALLLGAVSHAAQGDATSAPAPSTKAKTTSPTTRRASTQADAASKSATAAKLVDINSASPKELMTLPGISEADARKIVAGRPYGSKAHLVSRNIIDDASYQAISKLIIAKQPYKDGNKNAALYAPKK